MWKMWQIRSSRRKWRIKLIGPMTRNQWETEQKPSHTYELSSSWTWQQVQNEYDSGTLFYLDTEKGCNSEDACRCANELVHELTESKKRSGRQSAAPLMTWRQPTAHYHETDNKTSSVLMNSFKHHDSVRIYILLLTTLLSKLNPNSQRSTRFPHPLTTISSSSLAHAVE